MIPILDFDTTAIETAVAAAELRSTGEIRVCVERRTVNDVAARAREVFEKLGMTATEERNGVLIYVHLRQRELAVIGDSGIDSLVPQGFWQSVCDAVVASFSQKKMTTGVVLGIMLISEQLALHFPSHGKQTPNALPDGVANGEQI